MRSWVILALAAALVLTPAAYADIYVIVANTTVHRGGYLRGTGDGSLILAGPTGLGQTMTVLR
jgi:hypothetical protein